MSTPPSAPVIRNAPAASANTLEFFWYPPASQGSAPITKYRLTLQPGNLVYYPGPNQNYVLIDGLTNAQTYQTTIEATNDNGLTYGPAAQFREFQPGSAPNYAPSSVSSFALTTPGTALVSWTPPPVIPDATIFWYVVTTNSTNPADTVISTNGYALSQSNILITGLNSNSTYYFNVRAVNCPGYGPSLSTNTIRWFIPFSPTDLSNLQIWYDGADPLGTGTAPANGTSITTWADKSGQNNNATAPVAASYVIDANGNYLNFNGTSTYYNIASGAFIANQYFTVFVVERLQINTGNLINFVSGSNNAVNTNLLLRYTSANATGMNVAYYSGVNLQASTVPAYTTAGNQPTRVWSFTQKASFLGMYLNGALLASNANNTLLGSWNGPSIGRDSEFVGRYYGGHMKEILFFTGDMSTDDRQKMEGYLAWKWGLQDNLPAAHPYKSAAP